MLINATIAELDIKKASISVWFQHGAIDYDTYKKLYDMERQQRQVTTGLMRKEDPHLTEVLKEYIPMYISRLKEVNNIPETAVLKVVNDAVWLVNVIPTKLKFDKVEFAIKSVYDLYYKCNNYEFFLENGSQHLTTKGVPHKYIDEGSPMIDLIQDVLIDYLNADTDSIYNKLHGAKNKLMKDPMVYGEAIINRPNGNLYIVKNMIANLI